jgi:signal transduction histidine kinase
MNLRQWLTRYVQAGRTIFGRLRIRAKLNMLLALPLAAMLVLGLPLFATQVSNAGAAASTARISGQTGQVGGLVSALQRERLTTSAYLAGAADRAAVVRQQGVVDDLTKRARDSLGPSISDEMAQALVRVGSLASLRLAALDRGATQDSVARTYGSVDDTLIDALRLVPPDTSDAEGIKQLTALEALLRANEQSTLAGMALVAAASDPRDGRSLYDNARNQAQIAAARFVQQAENSQAGLVVDVEQGKEARAVKELTDRIDQRRNTNEARAFAADAYAGVGTQSRLRETVQDEVTKQITAAAQSRADGANATAWLVGGGVAALFVVITLVAAAVSRSIANPMRQLTNAATNVASIADAELERVADTEDVSAQVPRLAAIRIASEDEIGQLAEAFNRVQITAVNLVERQAVTRRNVGLMFTNVAQRTQNLVGRQLSLVDELERDEQNAQLLGSLYRLDHLSTRLRRTADNLLVVAGSRNDTNLSGPLELSVALRSALAQIEDYQRVQLSEICEITLESEVGPDLVLVFAELLENAASFSPPETAVEVTSRYMVDGSCVVSILDHGIGMTPEQLAQENQRLVARERLDIAPTSVLGLFVVGRLARRHSLTVAMVATESGGVTVDVVIPLERFHYTHEPETAPQPIIVAGVNPNQLLPGGVEIPPAEYTHGFAWFPPEPPIARKDPEPEPAIAGAPRHAANGDPPAAAAAPIEERRGLRRRVVGAQLPGDPQPPPQRPEPAAASAAPGPAGPVGPSGRLAGPVQRDAAEMRGTFDGYEAAINRATERNPAATPAQRTAADGTRSGLSRRVPGESLAPGLRPAPMHTSRGPTRPAEQWFERDATADRTKLDDFTRGFAGAAPQNYEENQ